MSEVIFSFDWEKFPYISATVASAQPEAILAVCKLLTNPDARSVGFCINGLRLIDPDGHTRWKNPPRVGSCARCRVAKDQPTPSLRVIEVQTTTGITTTVKTIIFH